MFLSTSTRWSMILLLSLTCLSFAQTSSPSLQTPIPTVNLGYATYQGVPFTDDITGVTNTQFLGIRYAAPPTGTLRFAAPMQPETTQGLQIAQDEPPACMQGSEGTAATTPFRVNSTMTVMRRQVPAPTVTSEDCLFLNVYVPENLGSKTNLPVVFWIHGGGYTIGDAATYDGNDLIREAGGNVVAVIIQYRLGVFGFLPGQKVKDGGALNAGLLDQQFALKWVQEHISKFGGDPSKVTIWGESAGAGSVLQHVVANHGKTNPPLFRAAITSSVYLPSQYLFNDRIPESLYKQTVTKTGCASVNDTLQCLRQADVTALQNANLLIGTEAFFGTAIWVPVVDGTFITDRPTVLLKQGNINGKALYSVTNTFEGHLFVDQTTNATVQTADYLAQLFPNLGPKDIEAGTAIYSGLGLSNIDQADLIMTDSIFVCPTHFLMRAFGTTAFKGEFAIPPGFHATDIPYYFNIIGVPPTYTNPAFNKAFPETFLNFAMALNPNVKWDPSDITPFFPPWGGQNEMLFNKTEGGDPDVRVIKTSTALLERCVYWANVSAATAQ